MKAADNGMCRKWQNTLVSNAANLNSILIWFLHNYYCQVHWRVLQLKLSLLLEVSVYPIFCLDLKLELYSFAIALIFRSTRG